MELNYREPQHHKLKRNIRELAIEDTSKEASTSSSTIFRGNCKMCPEKKRMLRTNDHVTHTAARGRRRAHPRQPRLSTRRIASAAVRTRPPPHSADQSAPATTLAQPSASARTHSHSIPLRYGVPCLESLYTNSDKLLTIRAPVCIQKDHRRP
ncbi:hypothetical protein GWI33_016264 [Rhynchophorus ferrugineus]|uniref:Uncharacterized protein n=1 Tax=Rhynchophorus ferrugineus TaxID=354439 RepID=A0A834M550_RHYFE|nr:hypothetical protein GWI33_016264 [Rhynchophorus ferrugineus]